MKNMSYMYVEKSSPAVFFLVAVLGAVLFKVVFEAVAVSQPWAGFLGIFMAGTTLAAGLAMTGHGVADFTLLGVAVGLVFLVAIIGSVHANVSTGYQSTSHCVQHTEFARSVALC